MLNKRKTSGKPAIVKASRYTHAKTGFLVFAGIYPNVKMKYCKTREAAEKIKAKWSRSKKK